MEKFESEEVQDMILKSIDDESYISQINSIIVDLIEVKIEEEPKDPTIKSNNSVANEGMVRELNSKKLSNLIDTSESFESRYME